MQFSLDDEQLQLRQMVRRAFADLGPVAEREPDVATWERLAVGQGLVGLAVPAELGGQGAGHLEAMLLLHECGRALVAEPFLETVALALPLLLALGDDDQLRRIVPGIVAGRNVVTLAGAPARPVAGIAVRSAADGTLRGTAAAVPSVDRATHVVVVEPAEGSEPARVALAEIDGADVDVPAGGIDLGRSFGSVTFDGQPADLVWEGDGERLDRTLDACRVLTAAELVGVAERCLELAVEHACARYQFGRPIGSFQAVKHRCADIFVEVELARAAVEHAAWALDAAPERVHLAAPVAVSAAISAAQFATQEALHVHGGLGFTWEHEIHRHLRRARATSTLLGGADAALRRVVDRSGWRA